MIFERPWRDLTAQEFDRLSIVHWSVFGLITLFWIATSIFDRHTSLFQRLANRLSFAVAGAAAVALAIWLCFPRFYNGPFADIDPRIIPIWLSNVREVQPLLSRSIPLPISVQLIGSAVVCFPFLFYLLLSNARNENRKGWIYISLSAIIFILASLYQIRWSVYAAVLLIIPMTKLMNVVLTWQQGHKIVLWRALRKSVVILAFCAGFLFLGLLAEIILKKDHSARSRQEISTVQLCEYLNEEGNRRGRNLRILTHIDFGPEILYRTQHEVIGTPYHRNGPGIVDTYDIMTADIDEKALELVQKREIDLILLSPKSSESAAYSESEQISTFRQRLRQDMIPRWLHKVELPPILSSSFLLFEITEK
ncbi:MAG: hypothetical protein ACYSYV_06850 [Planctomycetota bacterium]